MSVEQSRPADAIDAPHRIYLYKRYERFWHWSQAALIIFMLISGFEIHGSYQLIGFELAVRLHSFAAILLIILWVFTLFWHFTTGEWRQYKPTLKKIDAMMMYYSHGIFLNAPNPYRKTAERKHNPLQRMTYLLLLTVVSPVIWVSGLLYLTWPFWRDAVMATSQSLETIATVHTAAAFMMLVFLIGHLYLVTTGHTPFAHIRSMLTGWEEEEPAHERGAKK
ncbi:MAG: hypothetical protein RL676_888 [Pseudomonadota bacterium]|jgi:thiosulfate reductase cytochrome b subunit